MHPRSVGRLLWLVILQQLQQMVDAQFCLQPNRLDACLEIVSGVFGCPTGATCLEANYNPPRCCYDEDIVDTTTVSTTTTTVATSTAIGGGIGTGACTDLTNPLTGSSECQNRASLCNDPMYSSLMNVQCRATCGRCTATGGNGLNGVVINGIFVSFASANSCADQVNVVTSTDDCKNTTSTTQVSDCASMAYLCNTPLYATFMTVQCPSTCNRCAQRTALFAAATRNTSTCVDQLNPSTGISDCPFRASLCNDALYFTTMVAQCPRTCGRCATTG